MRTLLLIVLPLSLLSCARTTSPGYEQKPLQPVLDAQLLADAIRLRWIASLGLAAGMVDVKVCAIDDTWSGLKFVCRLKDRPR